MLKSRTSAGGCGTSINEVTNPRGNAVSRSPSPAVRSRSTQAAARLYLAPPRGGAVSQTPSHWFIPLCVSRRAGRRSMQSHDETRPHLRPARDFRKLLYFNCRDRRNPTAGPSAAVATKAARRNSSPTLLRARRSRCSRPTPSSEDCPSSARRGRTPAVVMGKSCKLVVTVHSKIPTSS
jgi:hypothetical protein